MSKKVNQVLFRLGLKNQWTSKYFEKNSNDFNFYLFKYLEIKNFFTIFFNKIGLNFVSLKYYLNKGALRIFICYYDKYLNNKKMNLLFKKLKFNKLIFSIINSSINKSLILKKHRISEIYKYSLRYKLYLEKNLKQKKISKKKFIPPLKLEKFYLIRFLRLMFFFQNFSRFKHINLFRKKIIKVLNLFFNHSVNISVIFKKLNKLYLLKVISKLKKIDLASKILNFKQFENNLYFKSGINLFYCLSTSGFNKNFSFILSNFIVIELSKIVNLNSFNNFLKFIIKGVKHFLLNSNKIKGLELKIKGNFGKNSRALFKKISVGSSVPKTKLNMFLDFKKSTAFSKKGTLGVSLFLFKNEK
jgi:hypothetical protein